MEIYEGFKMNRKFRIFYYSLMALLIAVLSYQAYLLVSILFELPDGGKALLIYPWE